MAASRCGRLPEKGQAEICEGLAEREMVVTRAGPFRPTKLPAGRGLLILDVAARPFELPTALFPVGVLRRRFVGVDHRRVGGMDQTQVGLLQTGGS